LKWAADYWAKLSFLYDFNHSQSKGGTLKV